jgi:hypothetical protein
MQARLLVRNFSALSRFCDGSSTCPSTAAANAGRLYTWTSRCAMDTTRF